MKGKNSRPPPLQTSQPAYDPPISPSPYSPSQWYGPSKPFRQQPDRQQSPDPDTIDIESGEKDTLLNQILPVPIAHPNPAIRNQPWFLTDISNDPYLISIRRISSLAIIFLFLVTLFWTAGMHAETGEDGSVQRQREAMEKFREGMASLGVNGAVVEIGSGSMGEEDEDLSVGEDTPSDSDAIAVSVLTKPKDWSQYKFSQTVSTDLIGPDLPKKRYIFIGDIHGSYEPLQRLLSQISYDETRDTIIHVGDLVIKGPESQKVVEWMRKRNALGVRGNHDQKVIEWRVWMEWAGTVGISERKRKSEKKRKEGKRAKGWRDYVDDLNEKVGSGKTEKVLTAIEKSTESEVDLSFPSDWEWRSEHWQLARDLPDEDYQYLLSMPLTLHIPAYHAFVVHAGLLPRDTTVPPGDSEQLLNIESTIGGSRNDVENAILTTIPQNQIGTNLLEMRSVKKNGAVISSGKKGTPWSDIWNQEMTRCKGPGAWTKQQLEGAGYKQGDPDQPEGEGEVEETDDLVEGGNGLEKRKTVKHITLPKLPDLEGISPVTVIYGHAASRGLDLQPFTKGLDSACITGHQLTALVLGDVDGLWDVLGAGPVIVDQAVGLIIQVDCKNGGGK